MASCQELESIDGKSGDVIRIDKSENTGVLTSVATVRLAKWGVVLVKHSSIIIACGFGWAYIVFYCFCPRFWTKIVKKVLSFLVLLSFIQIILSKSMFLQVTYPPYLSFTFSYIIFQPLGNNSLHTFFWPGNSEAAVVMPINAFWQ